MVDGEQVVAKITQAGLVPVIRLPDPAGAVPLAAALLAGGATAVELTMTTPGAAAALTQVRARLDAFARGKAAIGMGSIRDRAMAETAVAAGAQFLVAPHSNMATIVYAKAHRIPVIPGALTPTEMEQAWVAGASLVKLFPAGALGPGYLRAVLAPLPHLRLLPTGGITLENVPAFIRNGAAAVGVGSSLVSRELVAAGAWDALAERTARFVEAIRQARAEGA